MYDCTGGDPTLANAKGVTPAQAAATYGRLGVMRLIQAHLNSDTLLAGPEDELNFMRQHAFGGDKRAVSFYSEVRVMEARQQSLDTGAFPYI